MRPLVTIITPTHNHEKFIQKCIESVLTQTYQDWKMIIVDDASNDHTMDIIRKYSQNEKRIKVICHGSNWGIKKLVRTYNQALSFCKTKYVAVLEGDDYWPKDKLELQINYIRKMNIVFSFGNCILTSQGGLPIKLFTYNYDSDLLSNRPIGSVLKLFATLDFSIIPVTVVMRRKELISIGGFQSDKHYPFTDIPTFLKLSLKGKFSYQNEILGYYRKQSKSEWFSFASATSAMGREELSKCINAFLLRNLGNKSASKIVSESRTFEYQNAFVYKKIMLRKFSIFINNLAFKIKINPLFIAFVGEYLLYKLNKSLYENRN